MLELWKYTGYYVKIVNKNQQSFIAFVEDFSDAMDNENEQDSLLLEITDSNPYPFSSIELFEEEIRSITIISERIPLKS